MLFIVEIKSVEIFNQIKAFKVDYIFMSKMVKKLEYFQPVQISFLRKKMEHPNFCTQFVLDASVKSIYCFKLDRVIFDSKANIRNKPQDNSET